MAIFGEMMPAYFDKYKFNNTKENF